MRSSLICLSHQWKCPLPADPGWAECGHSNNCSSSFPPNPHFLFSSVCSQRAPRRVTCAPLSRQVSGRAVWHKDVVTSPGEAQQAVLVWEAKLENNPCPWLQAWGYSLASTHSPPSLPFHTWTRLTAAPVNSAARKMKDISAPEADGTP